MPTMQEKKKVVSESEAQVSAEPKKTQILESDFRDNALKDLERSEEGKNQDDGGKHPEEEDDHGDEDQSLEAGDTKDLENDVTEQETFEALDSMDQVAMEDQSSVLDTPIVQTLKEDIRNVDVEEDTYQVIDSLEDQTTTTEAQTDNKRKRTSKVVVPVGQDDRSSRRTSLRSRGSNPEEKETSPRKQDRSANKYGRRTKTDTAARGLTKDIEDISYTSSPVEVVLDAPVTERCGRKKSARGKKEGKTILTLNEESRKPDEIETSYETVDAVEEDSATKETVCLRRSTRGRKERATGRDASNEDTKREDMRRRCTRGAREKTSKTEERKTDIKNEDKPRIKSQSDGTAPEKKSPTESEKSQSSSCMRRTRRTKGMGKEEEEELVTVDEVGAEWDGEMTEEELQTLVILDEIAEEEDEQSTQEAQAPKMEDEPAEVQIGDNNI